MLFRPLISGLPQTFAPALAASTVVVFGGCINAASLPGVTPYRIQIQQGNFISQDMVAQLKKGMSREQVRFVLGTPLVTDIFHADRWDYVFYRELPAGKREQRNLAVFFKDGVLERLAGDVVPAGEVQPGGTAATERESRQ
jgi:outer membrane protein assembly factor BamE